MQKNLQNVNQKVILKIKIIPFNHIISIECKTITVNDDCKDKCIWDDAKTPKCQPKVNQLLKIGYQLNNMVRFGFVVNNLLNREYMTRPATMMPPRTFAFQCNLKI